MKTKILLLFTVAVLGITSCSEMEDRESDKIDLMTTDDLTKTDVPSSDIEDTDVFDNENEIDVLCGEEISEEVYFIADNNNTNFHFRYGEYAYVGYVKEIGKDYIIFEPVDFVLEEETERWLAFGHQENEGPYCDIRESYPLEERTAFVTDNTEIHVWAGEDEYFVSRSIRCKGMECVFNDLDVFKEYLKRTFTSISEERKYPAYPYFVILDEEGNVKYITEYFLV